jgi:tRNA(Ile)-lysidine synthase
VAGDLLSAVRAADADYQLFVPGEWVVVAVSGGPDSVALLHALRAYAPERALALHVAHLDHLLRAESAQDAAYVHHLATTWDLPVTLAARDVATLARQLGRGIEDAARLARYAFLARVAARIGAATVVAAHTADDQAETVLMNVLRGTGLGGLVGMRPVGAYPVAGDEIAALEDVEPPAGVWPPRLVRPFLAVDGTDIQAYLAGHNLKARDDASNRDLRFLRNRVRHELLPALEAVNPRVREALRRLSASAADDLAYLTAAADTAWPTLVHEEGARLVVDLAAWQGQAPALQRRILRRMADCLSGPGREFGAESVAAALAAIAAGPGARRSLPGGLQLEVRPGDFALMLTRPAIPPVRLDATGFPLVLPGTTELPGGWAITVAVRDRQAADVPPSEPWSCLLDAAATGDLLVVRARRSGDRMRPLGMGGRSKRLQDLFVDARVPVAERDGWPLLVAGADHQVVWVPGLQVSEDVRLRAETQRVVAASVRPPGRLLQRA